MSGPDEPDGLRPDPDRPRILLAVNGVDHPGAGTAFAAREARLRGGAVHVVHVVAPAFPALPVTSDLGLDGLDTEEARLLGRTAVEHAAAAVRQAVAGTDVPVSGEVLHGGVTGTLVAASREADLVVLTRGHARPVPVLAAMSVAHGVAARARCPVAVVPREDDGSLQDGPVALGVAGEESVRLVRRVLALARVTGDRVELVHGWWHPDHAGGDGAGGPDADRPHHERIDAVVGPLLAEFPDVETTTVVRHARPAEVLVEASGRARLVVVGRHHPALAVGSHLGPITRVVLRAAACPVVVEADPDPAGPSARHAAEA